MEAGMFDQSYRSLVRGLDIRFQSVKGSVLSGYSNESARSASGSQGFQQLEVWACFPICAKCLDADVICARVAVGFDPVGDRLLIAPGDDRIYQLVASPVGKIPVDKTELL